VWERKREENGRRRQQLRKSERARGRSSAEQGEKKFKKSRDFTSIY
jgi:hypothetical protein